MTTHKLEIDGDKLHVGTSFDVGPAIEQATALRTSGLVGSSDNRHVARVPMELVYKLVNEAGVDWNDVQARKEVLRKALLDGTLSKFRVWEGSF